MTIPTPTSTATSTAPPPYHLAAGDGPALWHIGALLTFKATAGTTGGRLWVQEAEAAHGYASPLHRHSREDEAFYVRDGEIAFHVGGDVVEAGPGSFVWGPRDVAHAFCVESETARFLAFSGSVGLEEFFFSTGEPAPSRTLPPPLDGPPDLDALMAAGHLAGVEMVGPPPAPRR